MGEVLGLSLLSTMQYFNAELQKAEVSFKEFIVQGLLQNPGE